MTEAAFRRIALGLPETEERTHLDHPDFRVKGKIFATLHSPEKGWGMVKLSPAEQTRCLKTQPDVFVAAKGAWGRAGCTHVHLKSVDGATLNRMISAAWRNMAPRGLVDALGPKDSA